MTEKRKLAAILAADVVGFSWLTCADEDGTLARLRALRSDLIDPTIAVHNGRVVKRTGDGALVEFRSVVDAVRCAIEAQNGMIERNAGLPPERRIEYRIGIHLGNVVEESDGDLMGDGVNIAARLESICEPGVFLTDVAEKLVAPACGRPLQAGRRNAPGLCSMRATYLMALSRCHAKSARGLRLTDFQAAATASRHVVIAAARSTR